MSKLIVEIPDENVRFIFRYSVSDQIRKTLIQNAQVIQSIHTGLVARDVSEVAETGLTEEIDPNLAEPEGCPVEQADAIPLNDGTATRGALRLLEENNLEMAYVPADGGRVSADHVRAHIAAASG